MHCGKLINQAEALQKDLSKRESIIEGVVVDIYILNCQVHIEVSREFKKQHTLQSPISWIVFPVVDCGFIHIKLILRLVSILVFPQRRCYLQYGNPKLNNWQLSSPGCYDSQGESNAVLPFKKGRRGKFRPLPPAVSHRDRGMHHPYSHK